MTNGGDEKIEMQGDMRHGCFLLFRHSLFPPLPPVFKVNKLAVSTSERKKEWEVEAERGMRETCRQTDRQGFYPLMCLMVPFHSKVYYRVLSLKPGPLYECPHQLDMMTKTLWVRVDKFPWLCAVQVYLALQPLDIVHLSITFQLCRQMARSTDSVH